MTASSVRKGRFPPILSTAAPNGMRSSEPVSAGIAARIPAANGDRPSRSVNFGTSGPKIDTPANPPKKPKVASHMAWDLVPRTRRETSGGTVPAVAGASVVSVGASDGTEPVASGVLMVVPLFLPVLGPRTPGFNRRYDFYMIHG